MGCKVFPQRECKVCITGRKQGLQSLEWEDKFAPSRVKTEFTCRRKYFLSLLACPTQLGRFDFTLNKKKTFPLLREELLANPIFKWTKNIRKILHVWFSVISIVVSVLTSSQLNLLFQSPQQNNNNTKLLFQFFRKKFTSKNFINFYQKNQHDSYSTYTSSIASIPLH